MFNSITSSRFALILYKVLSFSACQICTQFGVCVLWSVFNFLTSVKNSVFPFQWNKQIIILSFVKKEILKLFWLIITFLNLWKIFFFFKFWIFLYIFDKTQNNDLFTLILFYKQHMVQKTSWTFFDFTQSLLIFSCLILARKCIVLA